MYKLEIHKKNLKRLSNILIISFQRINVFTHIKNECLIAFPFILDLSRYIDIDFRKNSNAIYNLYVIVNHKETLDFSHYFIYIKLNENDLWVEFDDANLNSFNLNKLKKDGAYINIS